MLGKLYDECFIEVSRTATPDTRIGEIREKSLQEFIRQVDLQRRGTRLDTWKQDTPKEQLLALLGALLGELSNIDDKIQPEKALERARRWTREIKQLGDSYLHKDW